jgi:L-iditol 2-dehydrogenase
MSTMRVAMYYSNKDVRIEEAPIPEINDHELLVRVQACGICGSDVMEWYRLKKSPRVLGHEMTGDIVKVGNSVKNFSTGQRVFVSHHVPCNTCRYCINDHHTLCETLHSTNFYPGGFAEYLRVPEINVDRGVFVLPDDLSYAEGTFIEPLACVVRGMRIARMAPTKSILIIGSGVAGLLHIKLAHAMGAGIIFAVDITKARLEKAKHFGADKVFHAKDDVSKALKKYNDGRLADLVVVAAGVPSAVLQGIETVQPGGTLLLFAPTKPGVEVPVNLFDVWNKQVDIVSTYAGAPRDILEAIELIRSKQVKVTDMITHSLPLQKAQDGFSLVAQAEDSIKVIIEPQR